MLAMLSFICSIYGYVVYNMRVYLCNKANIHITKLIVEEISPIMIFISNNSLPNVFYKSIHDSVWTNH